MKLPQAISHRLPQWQPSVWWASTASGARSATDMLRHPPAADSYRWERERSAALKTHDAGPSRMRRAELLDHRALGSRRAGVGAGESSITHTITPRWINRFLADDDFTEQLARFVSLVVVGPIVAVLVGPGLSLGNVLYRGLERLSPRIGRLWAWPWIVISALVLLITGSIGWLTGPRLGLIPWFPMVWTTLPLYDFLISWACWQLVIAFAAVAWWIYAWGWRAVPRGAVEAPKQRPDGTWRVTPESERIDIGFDPATVPVYEAPVTYEDDGIDNDDLDDRDEEGFDAFEHDYDEEKY